MSEQVATRMVLIRHGEAQSHVEGRVGGDTGCTGLSDLGRKQAVALRDRLMRTGELADVTALYSSTLPRAVETASIIAPALGDHQLVERHDLREFDAGPEADGITWEEFEELYPEPDRWSAFQGRAPGSESWASFGARVGAALDDLADHHRGESIVVTCHGGVIEHSFTVFHGRGLSGWLGGVEIQNCGITEWIHHEQRPAPWMKARTWTLVRHNDSSHVP